MMPMDKELLLHTELCKFLQVTYDVIDKSYAIEWGQSAKKWLDDKGSTVLERGTLFLTVKDAYEELKFAKQQINAFIKMLPECQPNGIKTVPQFIDKIVGGNDGRGHCLQSATYSLTMFHNNIVDVIGIGEKFNKTKDTYKITSTEAPSQHLNSIPNFLDSSRNINQKSNLENPSLFFSKPLPERTFNRQPIEALKKYIKHNNNQVERNAVNKMICLLKNVPLDTPITPSENLALSSGKLGEIINQFPKSLSLRRTLNERNSLLPVPEHSVGSDFRIMASNNKKNKPTSFSKMNQWMPLIYKSAPSFLLSEAINQNDLEKMKSLLEQYDVKKFEERIPHGEYVPCLHIAVEEGKLHIVQKLLKEGFNVNLLAPNSGNRSALSFGAEQEHAEIIELLITNGANLDFLDNFGKTPLEWSKPNNQSFKDELVVNNSEIEDLENSNKSSIDCRIM